MFNDVYVRYEFTHVNEREVDYNTTILDRAFAPQHFLVDTTYTVEHEPRTAAARELRTTEYRYSF